MCGVAARAWCGLTVTTPRPTGTRRAEALVAVALAAPLLGASLGYGYTFVATIADWGWQVPGAPQAFANAVVGLSVALIWAALTSVVVGVRRVRAFLHDEEGRAPLLRWTLGHVALSLLVLGGWAVWSSHAEWALVLAGAVALVGLLARRRA